MSVATPFNTAGAVPASKSKEYAVVLRFAGLFPHQVRRYRMHDDRKHRKVEHVDPSRTHLNRHLLGATNWFETLAEDIRLASLRNINQEIEGLERAKRVGEAKKRLLEGPRDPWRKSKQGPLREFVITAHHEWFEALGESNTLRDITDPEEREMRFEALALDWLKSRFGDQVVHARAHRDETAYHIHGVIACWTEKHSRRSGRQKLLQPSSHPLLKDYEKAQDDIGAFFADLGLVRGERRAKARREARKAKEADASVEVPEPRTHVPSHIWRADEEVRLMKNKRELEKEKAETEAAKELAARQQREAKQQKARARMAMEQARQRESEAEDVLLLAEHAADGTLVPDPEGGMAVSPKLPSDAKARSRLAQLLAKPGAPARQLLTHLGRAYRAFGRTATAHAENAVSTRMAALERGEKAVTALRAKMLAALPEPLRKHFISDTIAETREAGRAIKALRKGGKTGDENEGR